MESSCRPLVLVPGVCPAVHLLGQGRVLAGGQAEGVVPRGSSGEASVQGVGVASSGFHRVAPEGVGAPLLLLEAALGRGVYEEGPHAWSEESVGAVLHQSHQMPPPSVS